MGKRLVIFWVLGAVLITLSLWILGNAERVVGDSFLSHALALFIAFVLVLAGGLAWITVAVAVSKH